MFLLLLLLRCLRTPHETLTSHIGDPDNTQTMDGARLEDLLQQYTTQMENLQGELCTRRQPEAQIEQRQHDAGTTSRPVPTETPRIAVRILPFWTDRPASSLHYKTYHMTYSAASGPTDYLLI